MNTNTRTAMTQYSSQERTTYPFDGYRVEPAKFNAEGKAAKGARTFHFSETPSGNGYLSMTILGEDTDSNCRDVLKSIEGTLSRSALKELKGVLNSMELD